MKNEVDKYLKNHLSSECYFAIHVETPKPNQKNIYYKEDKAFTIYPLSRKEENELYQCFKQMKSLGIIDNHEEYHNWKRIYGYPVNHANFYDGYNSWFEDKNVWHVSPGVLFKDIYEGK